MDPNQQMPNFQNTNQAPSSEPVPNQVPPSPLNMPEPPQPHESGVSAVIVIVIAIVCLAIGAFGGYLFASWTLNSQTESNISPSSVQTPASAKTTIKSSATPTAASSTSSSSTPTSTATSTAAATPTPIESGF